MSKTMIIAAAVSALVIAAPAFAQQAPAKGQSAGFGGRHGSATNLRDAPRPSDEAQSTGFGGRNGSATNLRDAPRRQARGHVKVFDGRDGAVTRPTRETPPARIRTTNNLKQVGLANH